MMAVKVTNIGIVDAEQYEVKIHFEINEKQYFCILNLSNGAFISNLVDLGEEESEQVAHYLSHKAQDFLAEKGIELPPELKCGCH